MFTILWDNDGVLVDTEGPYVHATKIVLETVGVHLTRNQYVDITLRHGESTFRLAAERGIGAEKIACHSRDAGPDNAVEDRAAQAAAAGDRQYSRCRRSVVQGAGHWPSASASVPIAASGESTALSLPSKRRSAPARSGLRYW
jgi:hypothetical protein